MTGNILENGTDTFTPVINRLLEITGEFIPYLIYIALGCLGISLLWKAVKFIIGYLENKSKGTIENRRREETEEERITREEDEARNKQNPYYNKKRDKPQKQVKFGQRGYNSRKD